MNIEKISVDQLKPAKYNPRKDLKPGDPEFEKLRRSVEEFGYVEPIIWNKRTGVVIGGHQRLKVLQYLGYTEVDCVVLDIDEQKEKALNVALNKISGSTGSGTTCRNHPTMSRTGEVRNTPVFAVGKNATSKFYFCNKVKVPLISFGVPIQLGSMSAGFSAL